MLECISFAKQLVAFQHGRPCSSGNQLRNLWDSDLAASSHGVPGCIWQCDNSHGQFVFRFFFFLGGVVRESDALLLKTEEKLLRLTEEARRERQQRLEGGDDTWLAWLGIPWRTCQWGDQDVAIHMMCRRLSISSMSIHSPCNGMHPLRKAAG